LIADGELVTEPEPLLDPVVMPAARRN
jgi:hypothetical protein